MNARILNLTVFLLLFCAGNGFSQLTMEDAVSDYLQAVTSHDPVKIESAWQTLNENESFIDYLKVNRPAVYERLLSEYENRHTDRETIDTDESWDTSEQAEEFPAAQRRSNREIAASEPNEERVDNRQVVENFPNQNRPSNQEVIRQRQAQDNDPRLDNVTFEEDDFANDNVVMLTVSGLNRKEFDALKDILNDEFKNIESIEDLSFHNGVAVFLLALEGNAEDLSNRLQEHAFPSFRLDLVQFRPNRIDLIFKSL